MQAYLDGKKIEARARIPFSLNWTELEKPEWNWGNFYYRVKEESRCRPYRNITECFKDVQKHGGWIKDKSTGTYLFICEIREVENTVIYGSGCNSTFQEILWDYVWADDGTPCGVKEESVWH